MTKKRHAYVINVHQCGGRLQRENVTFCPPIYSQACLQWQCHVLHNHRLCSGNSIKEKCRFRRILIVGEFMAH